MIKKLINWLKGEHIDVTIVRLGTVYGGWSFEHTIVRRDGGKVYYVNGHLGQPGDIINVWTWDLHKF